MPVSPELPEPGHNEAESNIDYPLLSSFLKADSPLWAIDPKNRFTSSSDWLNAFRVEVALQEEAVIKDYQETIGYPLDFSIKAQILGEATEMFTLRLFEDSDLRKIDSILSIIFLLGYELPEEVREKYLPGIFRTIHEYTDLEDSPEAYEYMFLVLQKGRNLWYEFHGRTRIPDEFYEAMVVLDGNLQVVVPDNFANADYDMRQIVPQGIVESVGNLPQPTSPDEPPVGFKKLFEELDMDGI